MTDEIEGILKVLESDKANADDKAKAYRNLYTLLKDESEKDAIYFLCSFLGRFLKRIMHDIQHGQDKVVNAVLHLLGYVTHNASVVTYFSEGQVNDLVSLLVRTIKMAESKGKCQLAVWCISVQALNLSKVDLAPLVRALVHVFQSPFKSQGLETEGMNAMGRLLMQAPAAMMANVVAWAPPLLRRLLPVDSTSTQLSTSSISSLSSAPSLREKAEVVWRQALPLLSPVPEELSNVIFSEITSSSSMFTALLSLLEDQDKDALHAVRVWGYLIRVLGKYLLRGDLINTLLKIPNKTFLHASTSVRIATFHNWRCLIDNFSEDMSSLNTRRLKLLMMPFYNGILKEEDASVRQTGFQTWAYLVAKLASAHILEDNEVFEQVVTSYLTHVVRDSEPEIFNLGFEAAGLLLAPEADERDNERALVRHSTLDSLGSLHLEISEDFFSEQNERRLEFFMDLVKQGITRPEADSDTLKFVRELWHSLLVRVAACYSSNAHLLERLFTLAGEMCSFSVKSASMLYEVLLSMDSLRKPLLSLKLLLEEQQVIPIVYLSYHWVNIGNESADQLNPVDVPEDFMGIFERILSMFNPTPMILPQIQILLKLIEQNTRKYTSEERGQSVFLQIWDIIAKKIAGIVTEDDADVFGSASLSTTIAFVNYALVLPLKSHAISPPPHIKTAWTNLFITYHRIGSLKLGTEFYLHIDSLVLDLSRLVENAQMSDQGLSDLLVMAVSVVLGAVDLNVYREGEHGHGKKKRKQTPSLHIPAFPPLLSSMLQLLYTETNASTPHLLRSVGKAFSNQRSPQDFECMDGLLESLVAWVKNPKAKSRESLGSPSNHTSNALVTSDSSDYTFQVKQAVDELWNELVICVKRIYSQDKFSTELLEFISPLLVAALSNKHRQIKNSAIQFWNDTFGRTKVKFVYPPALISILTSLKDKTNIELPWFSTNQLSITTNDKKTESNTPSIPLEDQTLPPISDTYVPRPGGLKKIALAMQQQKVSKTMEQSTTKANPTKKRRGEDEPVRHRPIIDRDKIPFLTSAHDHEDDPPAPVDPAPIRSISLSKPKLESPPISDTDEVLRPKDSHVTSLLSMLERATTSVENSAVTEGYKSPDSEQWTDSQLLITQKHLLHLASVISAKLLARNCK